MNFELELPRDVETDINEFLDRHFSGDVWARARAALVLELTKLEINPRLGFSYYGGPAERRLFYRFRIEIEATAYYLQLAYAVNEQKKLVTAHGFSEYSPPTA